MVVARRRLGGPRNGAWPRCEIPARWRLSSFCTAARTARRLAGVCVFRSHRWVLGAECLDSRGVAFGSWESRRGVGPAAEA